MSRSTAHVLSRINLIINLLASNLSSTPPLPPTVSSPFSKSLATRTLGNISQCRSLTNSILVLSFVQKLLLSNRTATNRELYYIFVTHFRNQRECDASIVDICNLLGVERISIGLTASPKGWFCGNIKIIQNEMYSSGGPSESIDGTSLSSVQGLPITREWIHKAAQMSNQSKKIVSDGNGASISTCLPSANFIEVTPSTEFNPHHEVNFTIQSNAQCVVVVEKEGVYTRLSEDRFFDRIPCILVTGKGFPDIATRALVFVLHHELGIPVYGMADCNPYGLAVLQTYSRGGVKNKMDGGDRYHVPIQWIGLRPSQLQASSYDGLPPEVYQKLTDMDLKKIKSLKKQQPLNKVRVGELDLMKANGWKTELESLHWLGIDFMSNWLEDTLILNQKHDSAADDWCDARTAI